MKSSTNFESEKPENMTERKIRVLRSDNGGEYTSNEFHDCCKEAGIKRELIVPYNPQQNGVAERCRKAARPKEEEKQVPKGRGKTGP
uniref:Integrase catalytic domain-containing protein n=1 Tax=Picea glauca TaxID=3330 RepID=A0A117NI28_PICGL|nr:hypothetical protein ABT39_MTgene3827 [Picea glauca]